MLNTTRVRRLLEGANQRRADGSRGLRARRAVRRLLDAGELGNRMVIDAVWDSWLHEADEVWWTALCRWGAPAAGPLVTYWQSRTLGESIVAWSQIALNDGSVPPGQLVYQLATAAARTDHPIGAIAREQILALREDPAIDAVCSIALRHPATAEFLVQHRIVPLDPVHRADFLLLSGQIDEYLLADPDRLLLARACVSGPTRRPDLLTAAERFEGLDVTAVLLAADRGERMGWLTGEVLNRLALELAGRRDWEQLWNLVVDLRPADAVQVIRCFREPWQPGDPRSSELFRRLVQIPPDEFRTALIRLGLPHAVQTPSGPMISGAFSRNARWLALLVEPTPRPGPGTVSVVDVLDGTVAWRFTVEDPRRTRIVYSGNLLVVTEQLTSDPPTTACWFVENGDQSRRQIVPGHVDALAPRFVHRGGLFMYVGPHADRPAELVVCRRKGEPQSVYSHADLPASAVLASEPSSGRVAIAGDGRLLVLDARRALQLRPLARCTWISGLTMESMCFVGPDRLATTNHVGIWLWRIEDDRITVEAMRAEPGIHAVAHLPDARQLMVRRRNEVWYLHADTLADAGRPPLHRKYSATLCVSATDGTHATGADGRVDVLFGTAHRDLLTLATAPMGEATAVDRSTVERASRHSWLGQTQRPLLDLLTAWLDLRDRPAA